MEYRRVGRSGLGVSAIGLGSWLTYGRRVDDERAHACLRAAYEAGVNFFDTADAYAGGEAEKTLGRWLDEIPRTDVVVATKVFFPVGDGPNDRGLSRKHVVESCEASLRRLGIDYVDLYQCHRFDPRVPLDETLRALDDLIAAGKVLYAGVSEWSADQIADAVGAGERLGLRSLVSDQPQYSLLARRVEDAVLPLCREEGLGLVVWSPLAGGVLTGKYRPGQPPPPGTRGADDADRRFVARMLADDVLGAVERLRLEVAEPGGWSVAQVALAWLLHQDGVASAIVGATRPEQVRENVAAADVELDAEALERVEAIMGPFGRRGQP
jgi:aryl-alcohol dehydrogenase-like predicted oxidoreductase